MTRSRYLTKQTCSSYSQYVKFGHLMTKNANMMSLSAPPNEDREDDKEQEISHPDSEVLCATQSSFIVLLI